MPDFEQRIKDVYAKKFEQKKTWYSPVANIYYKARPRYPAKLINRAMVLGQLASNTSILEIGCGPGNATVNFAEFGVSMTCLEPNQKFYCLAQLNCAEYPRVSIYNTSFEEWELEANKFNAVLSANAFHWIPPKIAYSKAAEALQNNGCLILLWNLTPEPRYEVYKELQEVYQAYAPSLFRYEGSETQAKILRQFRQNIVNSGYFGDVICEQMNCEVTYNIDDYLDLLSTLRKIDPQLKKLLFAGLREKLQNFGDRIELSFLAAVHVARKNN